MSNVYPAAGLPWRPGADIAQTAALVAPAPGIGDVAVTTSTPAATPQAVVVVMA
jgi:hypothetical protein